MGANSNWNHKWSMHNAVMCTLSLYDVIRITRHLQIKLKSFSKIGQPLHKESVRDCSFLYFIAEKSVIMSEASLVDVSIQYWALYDDLLAFKMWAGVMYFFIWNSTTMNIVKGKQKGSLPKCHKRLLLMIKLIKPTYVSPSPAGLVDYHSLSFLNQGTCIFSTVLYWISFATVCKQKSWHY